MISNFQDIVIFLIQEHRIGVEGQRSRSIYPNLITSGFIMFVTISYTNFISD